MTEEYDPIEHEGLKDQRTGSHGRVVSVRPPKAFLGNREEYHFTRQYATHAETWHIVEDAGNDEEYLARRNITFQDAEGKWWWIWHSYFHLSRLADEDFMEIAAIANEQEKPLWQVIL